MRRWFMGGVDTGRGIKLVADYHFSVWKISKWEKKMYSVYIFVASKLCFVKLFC